MGIGIEAKGKSWFQRLKVRFDWVQSQGEPWWLSCGESWLPPIGRAVDTPEAGAAITDPQAGESLATVKEVTESSQYGNAQLPTPPPTPAQPGPSVAELQQRIWSGQLAPAEHSDHILPTDPAPPSEQLETSDRLISQWPVTQLEPVEQYVQHLTWLTAASAMRHSHALRATPPARGSTLKAGSACNRSASSSGCCPRLLVSFLFLQDSAYSTTQTS